MGKLKSLASETVLYGLGSILPRFLNFLLVPLHTQVFGPSAYGVFTLLFSYVAICNIVFLFGMETTYFRYASRPGANEQRIFNLTQSVVVAISLFLSIVFLVMTDNITDYLDISQHRNVVVYIIIIMLIDAVVAIPFARLRHSRKPLRFAVGKLINIGLLVGLNVYLLLFSGRTPDIGFIFIANLVANSFYIIYFLKSLISWRPAYDRELTPSLFRYAYPIMITGIAGMFNENLSRIALERWLPENLYKDSKAAVGVFGANYKFAVMMNLAIQAFRYAAEPFFFRQSTEKNSPQLFAKVNHYFVIVCCFLLLSVSINLDILKYFLRQESYWEGLHIVPILLLAYLFLGVYYNLSIWFKLTGSTHWGTIITLVGFAVTLVGNFMLIPTMGYLGSSYAALACYFVMTALCYWLGQKYYPIPYSVGRDLLYIIVTTALVYAVQNIDERAELNQGLTTTMHILVMTVFITVVFFIERKGLKTQA